MSRLSETAVLKPRDPALDESTDEWQEFHLSGVSIYRPGNVLQHVSLLEASAGHPVTVEGRLEPLPPEDRHLYSGTIPQRKAILLLENVYTFSYGQYGDGSTAIWAAGRSGWYTLKPGPAYRPVYQKMVEAVKILYFVADSYRTPRTSSGSSKTLPDYSPHELFEKYASEELGLSDAKVGMEKIYEHKDFLITSMITGKEGLAWSKTPLYGHLNRKFSDTFSNLRQRLACSIVETEKRIDKKIPKSGLSRQVSVDAESKSSTSSRRRGRSAKISPETGNLDDHPMSDARDHNESLGEVADGGTQRPRGALGRSRLRPAGHGRRELTSVPDLEILESADESSEKEDDTDEETKLRSRKNKSSLRPRARKSVKSAGRNGVTADVDGSEHGNFDEDISGSTSSLNGSKRKTDRSDSLQRPPKRRNSGRQDNEGSDIPVSPASDGAEQALLSADSEENAELALRSMQHIPDPVQEDTWVCALDGCTHKVYLASNSDSQRLIRAHYELHAFDDDARVQMVKKLQAPSLPAGHLMERVKLHAKSEAFPGSRQMASRYPPPITQRY